jgi:hypothetical protein
MTTRHRRRPGGNARPRRRELVGRPRRREQPVWAGPGRSTTAARLSKWRYVWASSRQRPRLWRHDGRRQPLWLLLHTRARQSWHTLRGPGLRRRSLAIRGRLRHTSPRLRPPGHRRQHQLRLAQPHRQEENLLVGTTLSRAHPTRRAVKCLPPRDVPKPVFVAGHPHLHARPILPLGRSAPKARSLRSARRRLNVPITGC